MSRRRRLALALGALAVAIAGAAWFVLLSPLEATGFEDAACERCARLDDGDLVVPGERATALILYTGARVVPEAYAPVAERVAAAGFPVFVPRLPVNFAIFDSDAAAEVIDAHPEIDRWVIAGHSLGGVMAARFAGQDARIEGLVLWGSYPEESVDLSGPDLTAASIYGSNDGLSTPEEVLAAASRLPAGTEFVEIRGGNHAQFGNYGDQQGDLAATIPAADQWDQVAEATIGVLEAVSG